MSKNTFQYFQKENFIELKTLEYYFQWDTRLASNIFDLRHKLNPTWFEQYIKRRLSTQWYIMKNNTWGNKADWWIDLKGTYKGIPVYVQCKKYIKNSNYKWLSRLSDIRNFYWWVVDELDWNIKNKKVLLVFITTWSFTRDARSFAKRNNIRLLDYRDVAKISLEYTLETFLEETGNTTRYINKSFNKQEYLINYSFEDLSQNDILQFLKNVRTYIVSDILRLGEESTWFETFYDETLKDFANQRIHNFEWLKNYYLRCNNEFVRGHIDDFSWELISWFEILGKR